MGDSAPDLKIKSRLKQPLAHLDPTNQPALREAQNIMQQIGQSAHTAGLEAIEANEPKKDGAKPQRGSYIY